MERPVTRVALGKYELDNYVGIKPPLTEYEIEGLIRLGVLEDDSVQQIRLLPPACTLIKVNDIDDEFYMFPKETNERTMTAARQIKKFLSKQRQGLIGLKTKLITMIGKDCSPFNPRPSRQIVG